MPEKRKSSPSNIEDKRQPKRHARNPCPTCVENNNDQAQHTHSRSSSKRCPYHRKNKTELANDAFGGADCELFIIKVGCEKTCRIPGLQQQISIAVEKIRDVTFEAALLANRHTLRCMEERGVVDAGCFTQLFFYACMQLVCGKEGKCLRGLQETVYDDLQQTHALYAQLRPENLPVPDAGPLWHTLSAAAVNMEKDARNHMVANFAKKAKEYIFILLREAVDTKVTNKDLKRLSTYIYEKRAGMNRSWPPSVEKTDELEKTVDAISKKIELGPTPVTDTTLFARPHEYMPFFYKVLKFLETRAATSTSQAQDPVKRTSPPLGWIKRKCRTKLEDWKQLSKTKRRTLIASIHRGIMGLTEDILSTDIVAQLTTTSRSYLEKLVRETRSKIQAGTFQPKVYNTQKGGRLFTLAPLFSFQRRYIEIDERLLRYLIRCTKHREKAPREVDKLFWSAFDITRIGVRSLERMYTKKRRFWNVVKSDGTAIDFLFGRPKRTTPVAERTVTDIGLDLTKDRVWGVDPGITDAFVAVDGNGDESYEIRRTSTKEFYHISGWNRARMVEQKWRREADPELQTILKHMPSPKTANLSLFDNYIRYVLRGYGKLVQFYDERWRNLRFQRYIGRQKALTEVCRRFTTGGKKYGSDPSISNNASDPTKKKKWKPLAQHEEPEKRTVVAFGDGMFSPTMKGKRAGVSRVLFRALRHHDRLGHLTLVKVPEFRSSKVCSRCQTLQTLDHVRDEASSDASLHAVLRCKECDTVWNRDVNAARNLRRIALHMAAKENEVPAVFQRMSGSEPRQN